MIEKNFIESGFENQEKYQEYLIKLDESMSSVKEDESLHALYSSVNDIYSKLKSLNLVRFFLRSSLYISALSGIIYLIHLIIHGFWAGIAGLVFTLLFLVVAKIMVNRKIVEVNNHRIKISEGLMKNDDVVAFAAYVAKGIELKVMKTNLLSILTGASAFFVFTSLGELITGDLGLLQIGVALIFASLFAILVFYQDMEQLNKLKKDFKNIPLN